MSLSQPAQPLLLFGWRAHYQQASDFVIAAECQLLTAAAHHCFELNTDKNKANDKQKISSSLCWYCGQSPEYFQMKDRTLLEWGN